MSHAVVIGGSIAGLCAARVLSDVFDHVTMLDRDTLPADASERVGVPQGRHVHVLLERGRREIERLFPGFTDTMLAGGAHALDFGWEFAVLRQAGWQSRGRSPYTGLFASRTLLESVLRDRVRRAPRVEVRERTVVTGFVGDAGDGHARVRGVRLRAPDRRDESLLAADLIVDASGCSPRSADWLREVGLSPPPETVVDSFAGYSTRWYGAPDPPSWPREWWWRGIWIEPLPPGHLTGGVLFPIEGGRWIVTLGGFERNYPPTDEVGFTAALRRLRSPILADAVALATPLSSVYGNRAMENRFRHYERWDARPEGFVAVGDAVCKLNPVYGQGMASAATCAGILGESIRAVGPTSPELPLHFFRRQARFLHQPWTLAISADFRFAGTAGKRPPASGVLNAYVRELQASCGDAVIRHTLTDVVHMLRPSSALFGPSVLARVGMAAVRRRLAGVALHDVAAVPVGEDRAHSAATS